MTCSCPKEASCDHVTGNCTCPAGMYGEECNKSKELNIYIANNLNQNGIRSKSYRVKGESF